MNLEPGTGKPGTWNFGSLEPRTWASPPFPGLRTWNLEYGALSLEPAAWREPGAWGKKSHLNRLQEASWDLLPPGNQEGLQGEPKEVGKHLHLEWNPAWLEGGQRQPLGNLRRTPRHLHLRQEGNSAGVHWHCQNWNPEGAHQHHQEWNPEGGR